MGLTSPKIQLCLPLHYPRHLALLAVQDILSILNTTLPVAPLCMLDDLIDLAKGLPFSRSEPYQSFRSPAGGCPACRFPPPLAAHRKSSSAQLNKSSYLPL